MESLLGCLGFVLGWDMFFTLDVRRELIGVFKFLLTKCSSAKLAFSTNVIGKDNMKPRSLGHL